MTNDVTSAIEARRASTVTTPMRPSCSLEPSISCAAFVGGRAAIDTRVEERRVELRRGVPRKVAPRLQLCFAVSSRPRRRAAAEAGRPGRARRRRTRTGGSSHRGTDASARRASRRACRASRAARSPPAGPAERPPGARRPRTAGGPSLCAPVAISRRATRTGARRPGSRGERRSGSCRTCPAPCARSYVSASCQSSVSGWAPSEGRRLPAGPRDRWRAPPRPRGSFRTCGDSWGRRCRKTGRAGGRSR